MSAQKETTVVSRNGMRVLAGVVLSSGLSLAGLAWAAGPAQADNGYGTWCPGQPPPQGYTYQKGADGGIRLTSTFTPDMHWDLNVCHDWHRKWINNPDGSSIWEVREGSVPPINCGPGWCPVPPGTGE